jgi:hypothetical protein
MKNYLLAPALLLTVFTLGSCGDDHDREERDSLRRDSIMRDSIMRDSITKAEAKSPFETMCTGASQFALTIKNYKFQMDGDYAFETGNFDVKQSNIEWTNDSNAVITLKNYSSGDLVGDRKNDQVDIVIELNARHGKKIGPGTYKHSATDLDYSSFTTMTTSKGKVFFNWKIGMDEQGAVTIDYIEADKACGSFNLAVEKPDNGQIGVVRLNGSFRTE